MVVKNVKRRITSGVLALLMVLTMLPTNVAYAVDTTADSSKFADATVDVWYTYDVKQKDADGNVLDHADTVTGFHINLNDTDLTASDVKDYGVAYTKDESSNTWYHQSAKKTGGEGANVVFSDTPTASEDYNMEVYGCSYEANADVPEICSGEQYTFVPYYLTTSGVYVYGKKTAAQVLEAKDTVVLTNESLYGKGDGEVSLEGTDTFVYGDDVDLNSAHSVTGLTYSDNVKVRYNSEASAFSIGVGAYNYINLNCTDDLKDHYTVKVYSDSDCKYEITPENWDNNYRIKYGQKVYLTFEAKAGYSTDKSIGVHVIIGGQAKKFVWDSDKQKFILALSDNDVQSKDALTITKVGEGFTEKADAEKPVLATDTVSGNIYVDEMSISGANDAEICVVNNDNYKYEYSSDNGKTYTTIPYSNGSYYVSGLGAGTYLVRKVETENYKASPALEITITDGPKVKATGDTKGKGYSITTDPADGVSYDGEATLVLTVADGYYVPSGKSVTADVYGRSCTFTKQSNGTYTYTVSNVQTAGALSISNVAGIREIYDPEITTDLNNVSVYEGKDATFTVAASDADSYNLTYTWYGKVSGEDAKWMELGSAGNVEIDANKLTLKSVDASLTGLQIKCVITNEKGKATTKAATLTVNKRKDEDALTAEDVTVVDESIDGANDGSITLKEGLTYSEYEYSKDEGVTYTTLTGALTDLSDGTYYIRKKATKSDENNPSADLKVTIKQGKSVAEYVEAQSTDAYSLSVDLDTSYGDTDVVLTLTVKDGYYVPSSLKDKLTATVAGNVGTGFTYVADTTYTLKIATVSTQAVTVKDVVKILKVHNPEITTDIKDVTAEAGNTKTFTVDVKDEIEDGVDCGYCTLKYQWYIIKPGADEAEKITVGGTKATYTTTALKLSDNGAKYYCLITNEKGQVTSKVATLTVEPNLDVAYVPTNGLSGAEADLKAAVKENLANILPEDDYKLVNEGANVLVGLGADTLDTVSTADKNAVKSLASGKTEGKYLNIYLKEAIKNKGKAAEAALTTPVDVTFDLSKLGLTAASNKVRTYTVVRVKDGVAEVVASTLSGTSLTFATDGDADYTYAIYYTETIKDGIQNDNGTLHYYKNGKIDTSVDDLVYDSNYGWVKVKNGAVDVKYNGLYNSKTCGWWLVTNGKVNFEYSGLYYDTNCGWWLVTNGTVNFNYNGLYHDTNFGWWLVTNGTVNFNYNGLYYDTNCGWWLVTNGTVNFNYNGLYYDTNCGWWLVTNGTVNFDYNGLYYDTNFGWWLVTGGTVNFDYTDLYYDTNCGWWKVYGGTVDFGYTGWYGSPAFGNWYINGGQVVFF